MPFLQTVNGKYRVRIVVPPQLRPYLPPPHTGKANLTRALGTGNEREANRLAVPCIADFQAAITNAASLTENPPVLRVGTLVLAVWAVWTSPLASERQVLTFRTRAWLSFAPPTCRMPLGQASGFSRTDPGGRDTPRFRHRLIRFRYLIGGSLALACLNLSCRDQVPTFPQRSPHRS
jgi:hypothetical protein